MGTRAKKKKKDGVPKLEKKVRSLVSEKPELTTNSKGKTKRGKRRSEPPLNRSNEEIWTWTWPYMFAY